MRYQKERKNENNNNDARLNENLLAFKALVQEEIDTRRDKANDFRIMTSRSRFNLIRHMLACAEKNKSDYEKLLQSQDMDFTTLKHLEIDSFETLKKWAALIKYQAEIMLKLLHGENNSVTPENIIELNQVKKISHIIALLYSFANACGDEFPAKRELLDLLEIVRPDYVYRPYRKLVSILSSSPANLNNNNFQTQSQSGKSGAKNKNDGVNNSNLKSERENDFDSDNNEQKDESENLKRIQELTAQVNDLKTELEAAYFRVNACEEEYERLQKESSKFALIDVLAKMNSKSSRKMLDQFAKSEKTLKELTAQGFEIPPEIASVSLCVRLFMSAMRSLGVSPVHEVGELIELSLNEAENYDYNGSDFTSDDEKKLVQVVDTGWKYGDVIFSRPGVVEC